MREFRYHDELPARDGWPGGKRYGYSVERTFQPRDWTDADREHAHGERIALPKIDLLTVETWWDQPYDVWVEPIIDDLEVYAWDVGPVVESTRRVTHTARRYAFRYWRYTPPWQVSR